MQIRDLQLKRALRSVLFVLLLCLAGRTKMQAQTVQHINYGITSTDPPEVWVMGVDVSYYGNMLSITVPSSVIINMKTYTVVGINAAAFSPMTQVKTASIPSTVRNVGGFVNCAKLQTVNINSNVDFSIGGFSGCSKLTSVNISHLNHLVSITGSAFSGCTDLTSSSISLSNAINLSKIYGYAFSGCSKLSSISIPVNVTMIYKGAFNNCSLLHDFNYNARNCTTVIAPSTPSTFNPNEHWLKNTPIHNLSIGAQVQSIPDYAFYDCNTITSIMVNAVNPPILGSNVFYNVNKNIPVTVPCGSVNAYRNATGWSEFTNIQESSYEISVEVNPSEGGLVTGAGTYCSESNCIVTATANNGYTFTNWTENGTVVSTNSSYSFAVTSNRTLVANFSLNNYNISVVANPTTGGTITGGGSYTHGTTCNLMATANSGYTFTNWTENGTVISTDASYSFTVASNRNLMANFSANNYSISVLANPTTGGIITGGGSYAYGTTCTITATANSGYAFTNWTENDSIVSADAGYSFTVTGNRNLVANFSLNSYTISALANPTAGGSITGGGTYDYGASCTLTASANSGYTFTNWTKDSNVVSTDAIYSFPVTESGEYVANFELISYQITATANPTEGGTVTGGGTYAHGSICTLTAVSNEDYAFSNWTENGMVVSTDTVYSFTVSSNRILVANFTYIGTGGMLNGMFSVSNNTKVYFSQGNLQYQASTDTWRFATNQWDYVVNP